MKAGASNPASSTPEPFERPILGMGMGRTVVFATLLASILPLVVMHRYADARIATWGLIVPGSAEHTFWKALSVLGQSLTWFACAVVGFGVAAAFNWANSARWMGMLGLAVMWAGLADVAVIGNPAGAATAGAVAPVLSLWAPRWWPAWVGLAFLVAVAELIVHRTSGTGAAMGALLGAVGVLLIEYAWHHVAPDAPPRRGAAIRS
ncbi:MAG: hypothetical protein JNK53_04355 [Phycisphaerae bacterium]|nr:hypothetical protein [Phycisphaerae bacterium]